MSFEFRAHLGTRRVQLPPLFSKPIASSRFTERACLVVSKFKRNLIKGSLLLRFSGGKIDEVTAARAARQIHPIQVDSQHVRIRSPVRINLPQPIFCLLRGDIEWALAKSLPGFAVPPSMRSQPLSTATAPPPQA